MTTTTSQEKIQKYLMNTTQWMPMVLVKGEGPWVWDEEGRKYLDFVGGWAVCCLGHCHPVLVNALVEQARTLTQASPNVCDPQKIRLAELLVKNSCLDKVFFQSTGAEANEGAVKLARRYGRLKLNGAYEVITALNSFHGRTLAMTAATGQPHYQDNYKPLPVGFKNVPFNDVEAIKAATGPQTCAVMLEPVQGEGGVNIPADDYLKKVRQWCDEKGLLLILWLSAVWHRTRHHDPGEGARGWRTHRRLPVQRPLRRFWTGRPRLHLWRQPVGLRRGVRGSQVHGRE
jgi:acetylornithine/N-succinyldiaminopimelate aminotransferase